MNTDADEGDTRPTFTIGIPMVNEPLAQIQLAIQSVFAQSLTDWELIFLCDASPDEHVTQLNTIEDIRARVIHFKQPGGIARSLNTLAREAKGRFIAILAADDAWPTDRLELQRARMDAPNPPDVLAGQMLVISDESSVEGMQRKAVLPRTTEGWVAGTPISHATAIATPEWFQQHPYDESLIRAQDRAFWITSHQNSTIEILDDFLYFYRVPKPIPYKKYAWSSKYARRVIWKYGPDVISHLKVIRILIESVLKQLATKVSTTFG